MSIRKDFVLYGIIAVVFVGGLLLYGTGNKEGNIVTVKSGDKVLRKIDLNSVTVPFSFRVDNNGYNVIYVENGKISVTEADCPDKLCMKQSETGVLPVVCLPHKLVIDKNK